MDGALSLKFGITAGIRCFAGLIYFLLECLAGLENRCVAGSNLDLCAGCRVSAGPLIPVSAGEGAETNERYRLASGEGIHDCVENGINSGCCGLLGEFSLGGDFLGQFGFIHCIGSFFPHKEVCFLFFDGIADPRCNYS